MEIESRSRPREPESLKDHNVLTKWRLRITSPLRLLTIFSALLALGLFVRAIKIHDGCACHAILLVSFASSANSAASAWSMKFSRRRDDRVFLPPGHVVIRTIQGTFVVVHCPDDVARLLYFESGKCEYFCGGKIYQSLVLIGTAFLMIGIAIISNCSWVMQVAIGASNLLLNGLYVLAAISPSVVRQYHWDLSHFNIQVISSSRHESFTPALWAAIQAVGSVRWAQFSGAVPRTDIWDEWLERARNNIGNNNWDAVGERDLLCE